MSNKSTDDRLDEIEQTLLEIKVRLEANDVRGSAYDAKLDAYQRASVQVVNLAFALIVTAVLAIIVPAVTGG
jgi:hypothetical protein